MNRFHVHVAVNDLQQSVDFYTRLFGHEPSRLLPDYAKWMLEDPPVNFAISARGHAVGVNHIGIQTDSADGLADLRARAELARPADVVVQDSAACCYAKSEKHWTVDPQGLAWEHFHTIAEIEVFGQDSQVSKEAACCIPLHSNASGKLTEGDAKPACCVPNAQQPTAKVGS